MPLRNIPVDEAASLASLVNMYPRQISSKALSKGGEVDITLLAFPEGESVSEEEYFGDTFYYVVEGSAQIVLPDRLVSISTGEIFMVAAHVLHAVQAQTAFKVLQLTLP